MLTIQIPRPVVCDAHIIQPRTDRVGKKTWRQRLFDSSQSLRTILRFPSRKYLFPFLKKVNLVAKIIIAARRTFSKKHLECFICILIWALYVCTEKMVVQNIISITTAMMVVVFHTICIHEDAIINLTSYHSSSSAPYTSSFLLFALKTFPLKRSSFYPATS